MKRDALAEAARALRQTAEPEARRADETRARVMASLRAEQARRLTILRVAIPLAAVLVGSLAWAATAGKLPTSIHGLFAPHETEPPAAQAVHPRSMPSGSGGAAVPPEPIPAATEAPIATVPSTAAPSSTLLPGPEREPASVAAQPRSEARVAIVSSDPKPLASPATRPTPNPPASPTGAGDEALYTRAHRLHFVDHDPGAALAAWDAYLRAFPRGRLAPESRYNRALCLVRLGRSDEARAALAGFAKGAYGGYRQAEARALLEAMGSAVP